MNESEGMGVARSGLIVIVCAVVVIFAIAALRVLYAPAEGWAGKAEANAQHKAYVSSDSKVTGTAEQIDKVYWEWKAEKDPASRAALAGEIHGLASQVDTSALSPQVQDELREVSL